MSDVLAVNAVKVQQWLAEWDEVPFDPAHLRRRPQQWFYLFSLSATRLRALSGISIRTTARGLPRAADLGIQRRHDEDRSQDIHQFVRYGFPCSELPDSARQSGAYTDLLKPGWLPTAIVVNIVGPNETRNRRSVDAADLVRVEDGGSSLPQIVLPSASGAADWRPRSLPPLEVIDGQHRLWAFDDQSEVDFQLPVVAFDNLDISWQAYLFWTINIRPKRINASLAFDLYPLLRTEDWLDRFQGHSVYRETRAQELTEALWSYPRSPWYHRINMLGEPGTSGPRQAAWIRSLLATFVKPSEGRRVQVGGLFGAPVGEDQLALPWSRTQQAGFLIYSWQLLQRAIEHADAPWAQALRASSPGAVLDPAFAARESLLNTDQGVRGYLYAINDLCFRAAIRLDLQSWVLESTAGPSDHELDRAISSLEQRKVGSFLARIANHLAAFDWRTSSAPGLSDEDRLDKAAIRGGGGYKILRTQLLTHLSQSPDDIGTVARQVLALRGDLNS